MEENIHRLRNADPVDVLDDTQDYEWRATAAVGKK